jgi:transcriptional regulator with XRE-family HTH domain
LIGREYGHSAVPGLGTRATACERCAKERNLSQGDIEKRTDLLRCYLSRVENGHTVPTVETSEKMARALELPMYELLYDGQAPPKLENLTKPKTADETAWGSAGKDARYLLHHVLDVSEQPDSLWSRFPGSHFPFLHTWRTSVSNAAPSMQFAEKKQPATIPIGRAGPCVSLLPPVLDLSELQRVREPRADQN